MELYEGLIKLFETVQSLSHLQWLTLQLRWTEIKINMELVRNVYYKW